MDYISFDCYQLNLLFKIIADKRGYGSIIVTTNLSFSNWIRLFENEALVSTLINRLTFRPYVLNMNGESYQLEHARSNN